MWTETEGRALIRQAASQVKLQLEEIPILSSLRRVLGESLLSPCDLPHWNHSTMDGYAVRSEELKNASSQKPVLLKVVATRLAGDARSGDSANTQLGNTVEIMTGAPIPLGFDAVVRIEDTELLTCENQHFVRFHKSAPPLQNMRLKGDDVQVGQELLPKGTVFSPKDFMVCAAAGVTRVKVFERPKVAIITTGDELVPMDCTDVPLGSIRNSSLPYAVARLTEMGCEVVSTDHVSDDPAKFESLLQEIWEKKIHITLTTGGVSMGKADFVKESLKQMGTEIIFHKLAVRPGKPILFGKCEAGLVFGCPGNPVSTAVALEFFVQEAINCFLQTTSQEFQLPLAKSVTKPKDLTCLLRGRITPDGKIEAFSRQASADVCSFAMAQHWVVLDQGTDLVPAGQKVTVRSLH